MPTTSIRITSPSPNEVFTYPLAIIRGITTSIHQFIYIETRCRPSSTAFPVRDNAFTALYLLTPGLNHVRISQSPELTNPATIKILFHPPPSSPPYVRLIYLLTSDSDGTFQSPETSLHEANITAGTARLQTAGLLVQSAMAEMMHAQELQRRTFRLAPQVIVHRLPITTAEAHKLSDRDLFYVTHRHLSSIPDRDDVIDLTVMSFTHMTPSGVRAHTALGGGNLALFGGGSLFTWPANVWEIPKRLLDFRTFDDTRLFDDSGHRMTYMGRRACTATTIGALLHELGHCFSLPHPCGDAAKNGGGIMARGFDWFDRLFIQSYEDCPFWDRGSALRLRYHRFMQFKAEPEIERRASQGITPMATPQPQPMLKGREVLRFERARDGRILCHSDVGIGHVGYYCNGDNAAHEEFEQGNSPKRFCVPEVDELRKRCQARIGDKLVISAIDIEGRIAETAYEDC